MREPIGGSPEDESLFRHVPGRSGWRISNDVTQDSIESIMEDAEDLFT